MSYTAKNSTADRERETASNSASNAANCCSRASSELKLYQAFIFSVPIFFTFVLLLLFYLFYLRRRRVDWSSLRMRAGNSIPNLESGNDISTCELGVKKELREMLPIIVYKESFSVKDTQCSVCLGDYQADDRLQQIPACGHTFHMDCIDLWLATHTTCPLCRQSLLPRTKSVGELDTIVETNSSTTSNNGAGMSSHQNAEDGPETSSQLPQSGDRDETSVAIVEVQYDGVDRDMDNPK